MASSGPGSHSMHDQLRSSMERMHGRARLDAELTRLAIDVVGPFEPAELPPDDSAWLEERVSRAVRVAAEPALAALMDELARELDEAPEDLLARVTREKVKRELGDE